MSMDNSHSAQNHLTIFTVIEQHLAEI